MNDQFITADSLTENQCPIQSIHSLIMREIVDVER